MKTKLAAWRMGLVLVAVCLAGCVDKPGGPASGSRLDRVDSGEVAEVVASYLDEPIAPCTPVETSNQDPCPTTRPESVAVLSVSSSPPSWPYTNNLPAISELVAGYDPITASHVVVRATVLADSTRCELYPVLKPSFSSYRSLDRYNYLCFVDLRVNEYIVGTGPAKLTTELHREVLTLSDAEFADWENWKDDWLTDTVRDPQSRTAAAYEGREIVVFLRAGYTIAVEAWGGSWGIADVWFVQQPEVGPVRAVAPDVVLAETEEQRAKLDMPLADLVAKIQAAAAARDARFGGRIGEDVDLPLLVTDANYLRRYYKEVGAVYRGDDRTTVLPPAAGGLPGLPTNVAVSQVSGKWMITWDAPATGGDPVRYYLWIKSAPSGSGGDFYDSPTIGAEREFDITGMVAYLGSQFTVQVRAWNGSGYSPWTDLATFTTSTTTSTTSTTAPTTSTSAPTTSTTAA